MKTLFTFFLVLFVVFPVFAGHHEGLIAGGLDGVPEPDLLRPMSEEVNLSGQEFLEFKWIMHAREFMEREKFDFRIYKGYQMLESTLIFSEELPGNEYSINVPSTLFADGEIYTWSIRYIAGVAKSDKVHHPFKVIKK